MANHSSFYFYQSPKSLILQCIIYLIAWHLHLFYIRIFVLFFEKLFYFCYYLITLFMFG